MKRDPRKAEVEEKWREKDNNREQWKQITKVVVQWSDNWPASPLRKEKRRRGGRTRFRNIIVDLATHPG